MQGYSALKSLEVCLHPFFIILPLMLSGSMHLSLVANYLQDFSVSPHKIILRMLTSSFSKKCFDLKGQCHEIFDFSFLHESVSPKPLSVPLGPLQIFSKICRDIRNSRYITGGK
jgi:hypothetical protein